MKKALAPLIIAVMLFLFPIHATAHPGSTDGSGGHYDRSTGEYHYHHGYSAHNHYDMDGDGIDDCPYNFVDKTEISNNGSSKTEDSPSSSDSKTPSYKRETDSDDEHKPERTEGRDFWVYLPYYIVGAAFILLFVAQFIFSNNIAEIISIIAYRLLFISIPLVIIWLLVI